MSEDFGSGSLHADGGETAESSVDVTDRCGYCEKPREQHPVYDDNGGLACSGKEAWYR